MRHGEKSRTKRFEGRKRHVLRDPDTGSARAVGVTPANAPEAKMTESITCDLTPQEVELKELHIDWAYLSSELVREGPDRLEVYRKAWAVHNRGRYPKTDIGRWHGEWARYVGMRKNPFDLRHSAVVHDLHAEARMPEEQEREEIIAALLLDRRSSRGWERGGLDPS